MVAAVLANAAVAEGAGMLHFIAAPVDAYIEQAIEWVRSTLVPAGEEVALQGIDFAIRLLSCKRPDADVLKGYATILGDLPNDLLPLALKGACGAATYHKLPPPGVFIRVVDSEWSRRKSDLSRLCRHRDRIQLCGRMRPHRIPAVEAAGASRAQEPVAYRL
jgi:hypothetical protein